jgi:hypothetical protein
VGASRLFLSTKSNIISSCCLSCQGATEANRMDSKRARSSDKPYSSFRMASNMHRSIPLLLWSRAHFGPGDVLEGDEASRRLRLISSWLLMSLKRNSTEKTEKSTQKCTDVSIIRFSRVKTGKNVYRCRYSQNGTMDFSLPKCTDLLILSIRVIGSPAHGRDGIADSMSDGRS